MGILDLIRSGFGALRGSPGQVAMTPPFVPGGMPNMSYTPARPGLMDILAPAMMSAGTPGTGSAGMDAMRAMALGFQTAQDRQQNEFQKQIMVQEMNRKANNDAILAKARLAQAERSRLQAEKDLAQASKKPQTLMDKFNEAKTLGLSDEDARNFALGIKPGQKTQGIKITGEAAAAAGFHVPHREEIRDVQVPTTDPVNDRRTVQATVQIPEPFIEVPANQATAAQQALSQVRRAAMGSQGSQASPRSAQAGDGTWVVLDPNTATAKPFVYESGEPVPIYRPPTRQRGGGGGGSSERQRAFNAIEKEKANKFNKAMQMVDEDPASSVEKAIDAVIDAQGAYESAIVANGGSIDPAESERVRSRLIDSVYQRAAKRIEERKAKQNQKKSGTDPEDAIVRRARATPSTPSMQPQSRPRIQILEVK